MAEGLSRKLARRLAGLCLHCSASAIPDSDYCETHAIKTAEYGAAWQRNRRQERIAAGLCVTGCGKRAAKESQRCGDCGENHAEAMRSLRLIRKNKRGVEKSNRGVETTGADPAFRRVARTKIEKAYDVLVSGEERFIERTVFRTRGGQTRESMDADLIADVDDAVRLLVGFGDRLRKLRAVEGELGRIQRGEARAAAADPLLRAARLAAGVAAALYPDGWKLVRDGLLSVAGKE